MKITDTIRNAAARVAPGQLTYVEVRPAPGARPLNCHLNVAAHARRAGGRIVYGWLIWEGPEHLQFEHHAVWESPQGGFVDVTPQQDGERQILFLPDPARPWQGRRIAPIHLPTVPTAAARALCDRFDFVARVLSSAPCIAAHSPVGRNAPCPCGSGRKHKRCCGRGTT